MVNTKFTGLSPVLVDVARRVSGGMFSLRNAHGPCAHAQGYNRNSYDD